MALVVSAVNTSLRRPVSLTGNLLTSVTTHRESFIAGAERAYVGDRVLSRQKPLCAPTAIPGKLAGHCTTSASILSSHDLLQSAVLRDLTDHRRAPARAAAVATRKPPPITVAQYVERSDPSTLDAKRFLAISTDRREEAGTTRHHH